jgi:hypothetical protein
MAAPKAQRRFFGRFGIFSSFAALFAGYCRKDFLKAEKAETRSVAGRGLPFSRGA